MRAWLLVCAALALAPGQPPAPATAAHPPAHPLPPDRLQHIKTQILAKLGLSSRPTPLRAPPRDVVRKILQRAADPAPAHSHPDPEGMREIIAIAHRGFRNVPEAPLRRSHLTRCAVNSSGVEGHLHSLLQFKGSRTAEFSTGTNAFKIGCLLQLLAT